MEINHYKSILIASLFLVFFYFGESLQLPSFTLAILLRAELTKGQFVQPLFMRSYNALAVSPLGSENLLVVMWPESFGRFTFDLGPLLQAL